MLRLMDRVFGQSGGAAAVKPKSAREIFFEIVEEVARREHLPFHVAMRQARTERPAEFLAAFPHDRGSAMPAMQISKVVRVDGELRLPACDELALAA